MRRRQADDSGSSLDLLLDTICNTFGALIFLALLMSVLVSKTSRTTSRQAAGTRPAVSTAEVTRLRARLATLEGEVVEVREILEDYRGSVSRGATSETVALVEDIHRLRTAANANEVAQARLLLEAAEQQAATARARAAAQAAQASRDRAAVDAERAQSRLDAAKQLRARLQAGEAIAQAEARGNSVQTTGSAPQERSTFKQEFGVLIRYGRLYLTHRHSAGERQVNHQDFIVIPGVIEDRAHARPAGGLPLAAPEAAAALEAKFADYPADEWYPCVIVHPDSFEEFQVLKNWLVARGYEYRLLPTDDRVHDGGDAGGSKVQ